MRSRWEVHGVGLDLWLLKGELNLGWLVEFLLGSALDASLYHAIPGVASLVCLLWLSPSIPAELSVGPLALPFLFFQVRYLLLYHLLQLILQH